MPFSSTTCTVRQRTHSTSRTTPLTLDLTVIIGLHSLPGGVNNLDIGEALFHNAWFNNATNLDYSFRAIDGVLTFIKQSGHMNAFTVAPINEASDNFAGFGSAAGLTVKGTDWINTYLDGVLAKITKVVRSHSAASSDRSLPSEVGRGIA